MRPVYHRGVSTVKALSILEGSDRSLVASLLRLGIAAVEPGYAAAMRVRNWMFDTGLKRAIPLGRPTISIGNLTTGGTGKTPVVRWLAERLRDAGQRPAVLMRGYGATAGTSGDEQRELDRALNPPGTAINIPIHANPSRVTGAAAVLHTLPDVTVFLLDDGFQHRRAARNFDLVLVSATAPFGFGHVLPRGLLREPASGLARASAILVTHQSEIEPAALHALHSQLKRLSTAPLFLCDHAPAWLRAEPSGEMKPVASLATGSPLLVAGIGDPAAFGQAMDSAAGRVLPHRWFADHHAYTPADIEGIRQLVASKHCDRVVTTEKDWSKLASLPPGGLPFEVVQLSVAFAAGDAEALLANIAAAIANPAPAR